MELQGLRPKEGSLPKACERTGAPSQQGSLCLEPSHLSVLPGTEALPPSHLASRTLLSGPALPPLRDEDN